MWINSEHDELARILKMYNVDVVYLEDLMTEVLDISVSIKEKFINQFVYEAGIKTPKYRNSIIKFLMNFVVTSRSKVALYKTWNGERRENLSP